MKTFELTFGKNEEMIRKKIEKNIDFIQNKNPTVSVNELLKFAMLSFVDEFTTDSDEIINIDMLIGTLCREVRVRKKDFNNQEKRFFSTLADKLSYKNIEFKREDAK